jgi:hypothetical protein
MLTPHPRSQQLRRKFERVYEPELVERLLDGLRKAGLDIPGEDQPAAQREVGN